MSAISLKSITGITSITTPAGVDNQLTLHTNDTTQRLKVTESGVEVSGVTTTGQINANGSITATRLTVSSATPRIYLTDTNNNDDFQVRNENGTFEVRNDTDAHTPFSIASNNTVTVHNDLDVDGHTNLDNVSIAGVTTMTGNLSMGETLTISGNNPNVTFTDTNSNPDYKIYGSNGAFTILDSTNGVNRFAISSTGNISISNDLDVDGHTNLDNVSIAGVTTFTGNANFGSNGSITSSANFSLSSNKLRVTGSDTVGIECQRAGNATIQCTDTSNSTDLQLRAHASGGLVRTATNTALNLGTFQKNRIQITNDGKVQIGLPGSSTSLPGAVEVVNIRAMTDGNLCVRAIGSISGAPSGSGVGIDVLNDANNAVKDLALRGSTVIFKGASAETLRISSDGNIGINDTDPPNFTGYKSLSIHGSTGGALVFGDDGTDEWEVYGGDGVFKIYDRAATTTRLHLTNSYGQFGINTSSFSDTATALSLRNGRSDADHTILDIICNDNQTARLTFSEDSNSSKGSIRYYYTGDANYMAFYTNGGASTNERLRINSNGSFNIGGTYTGTTHKLQVDNGTTHFKGRVFIRGTMSFNSTPFGANVTYDTGISVNAGGYGGSILAICSKNFGAGTNTQSGVYLIKFHYDGNNTPSIQLIAGSNLATFGQSGSNTLTVAMGASNNMFTAIESSVVPTT